MLNLTDALETEIDFEESSALTIFLLFFACLRWTFSLRFCSFSRSQQENTIIGARFMRREVIGANYFSFCMRKFLEILKFVIIRRLGDSKTHCENSPYPFQVETLNPWNFSWLCHCSYLKYLVQTLRIPPDSFLAKDIFSGSKFRLDLFPFKAHISFIILDINCPHFCFCYRNSLSA